MTNVKNLYTELSSLRRHLEKVCFVSHTDHCHEIFHVINLQHYDRVYKMLLAVCFSTIVSRGVVERERRSHKYSCMGTAFP